MSDPRRDSELPVDPDLDDGPRPRTLRVRHPLRSGGRVMADRWDVLLVIGAGGAVGASARWGVSRLAPTVPGHVPWGTLVVNVSGCLALGVLMVFVVDVWTPRRYVRPFLGVGVLGGYTTFSTYVLEVRSLLVRGDDGTAALYLGGSLVAGLLAVWVAIVTTRAGVGRSRRRRAARGRTRQQAVDTP